MSNVLIYNDDCANVIPRLSSVDHIVVDLPYFNVVDSEFDNQWKTLNEYLEWIEQLFTMIKPLLNEKSNVIVFTSRQYNRHICNILDKLGFIEKRIIIWARKRGFNNTRGKALASGYEPICYYSNSNNGVFNNIKIKVVSKRKEYN